MAGCLNPVAGQSEVLTDRSKARQKRLRALRAMATLHLALAPACALVIVFRVVIDSGRCHNEDVLHVGQFGYFHLRYRIAA